MFCRISVYTHAQDITDPGQMKKNSKASCWLCRKCFLPINRGGIKEIITFVMPQSVQLQLGIFLLVTVAVIRHTKSSKYRHQVCWSSPSVLPTMTDDPFH